MRLLKLGLTFLSLLYPAIIFAGNDTADSTDAVDSFMADSSVAHNSDSAESQSQLPRLQADDIEWLSTIYDFGVLSEEDGEAAGKFRFVNKSDSPVSIIRVKTSCGCTQSSYPRTSIAPKDTATIQINYDPVHRPGPFDKSLRVFIAPAAENQSETEALCSQLFIKGKVLASRETIDTDYPVDLGEGIRVSGRMVNLGKILAGASRHGFLQLYNTGQHPIYSNRIASHTPASDTGITLGFKVDSPALEVKIMPDTIMPGELGIISFCLDAARETGAGELEYPVYPYIGEGPAGNKGNRSLNDMQLEVWAEIEGIGKSKEKKFSKTYVEKKGGSKKDKEQGEENGAKKEKKKKKSRYGKTYTDVKKIPTETEKAAAESNRGWKSHYTEVKPASKK